MQEKALVAHLELHKKVVKNAWILSYEGRKVLVIEFQETATEALRISSPWLKAWYQEKAAKHSARS